MNLDPTDTQRLLQETVRGFLEAEAPYDRTRRLEAAQDWDAGLWQKVCDQGFLDVAFEGPSPSSSPSSSTSTETETEIEGSLLNLGLVVEEFARRAVMAPILEVAVAGRVLLGSSAPAEGWLSEVKRGGAVPVPAILEAGDCFGAVDLVASEDGHLTGTKYFVDYGQHATHHVVAARRGDACEFFWVDARGEGVVCEPLRSVGRTPVAVVRYSRAPAQHLMGGGSVAEAICLGRVLAALQCVGSMQTSLDMTVAYANVREQFGQTIGRFQAVRHHCANMASRVASARLLALEALSALDRGEEAGVRVAAAKAAASRAAPEVLMLGHQVHGGNGVIEENDLYFFTLRGKERSLAWGSVDECLDVMAAAPMTDLEWF